MKKIVFIFAFLLIPPFMPGCGDETSPASESGPSPEEKAARVKELPLQQFFDYNLVETANGIPKWILKSDQMNRYAGQRDAELITVHIDFYREGEHFSTLTSDSGLANMQTRDIHTWGDVVVVTQDGRRLDTAELFFDNKRQIIHNDVYDLFTREDDVVEGIGLEATPDLEYIEIKRQVEADVLDDPERETR